MGNLSGSRNKNNTNFFNNSHEQNIGNNALFLQGINNTANFFQVSKEESKKVDDDFLEKSGIKKRAEENGCELRWVNLIK